MLGCRRSQEGYTKGGKGSRGEEAEGLRGAGKVTVASSRPGQANARNIQSWCHPPAHGSGRLPQLPPPALPSGPVLGSQARLLALPRAAFSPVPPPLPTCLQNPSPATEEKGEAQRAPPPELTPVQGQMGLKTPTGRCHLAKPASRTADTHTRAARVPGGISPPHLLCGSSTGEPPHPPLRLAERWAR